MKMKDDGENSNERAGRSLYFLYILDAKKSPEAEEDGARIPVDFISQSH